MQIIGYHISNGIIANSLGEICTEQPFLDFLLEPKENSIKVFAHMGHSVANILKMLNATEREGRWLQSESKLRIEPYNFKHRAGKYLSIKKGYYYGSPFANFSDMSQYRPADFMGIMEYPAHHGHPSEAEWGIHYAKEAQKTGEEVYGALVAIGLHPTSLTSPINAYNKEILSRADLPTIDDMPEETGLYAYQCCQGSWLEAFQLGHWEVAWDYDINSAYPSELAKLLDIRLGKWVKSEQWIEEAVYGFCKGIVNVTAPFSPVIFSKKSAEDTELNYTPTGSWERFLTKRKIEYLRAYGKGGFQLIDGWFWIPGEERRKVLAPLIGQLYWQKERSEGVAREVVKRTMSGIWGMFLQAQKDGFGDLFNPVYGAEVESNIRTKVAEFVLNNKINPIHISLDGVLSPTPVLLKDNGARMGEWELASAAPCFCAGTAAVAIQGRGKTADFSIDYDWLMGQIREKPEAGEYPMSKLSPVTLAVALRGNWEHLGELRTITKTVYVGGEEKRYYKEKPECGGDLLERQYGSEPWDASLLSGLVEQK